MAMLVEDGYRAPDQRAMHPFFRQAHQHPQRAIEVDQISSGQSNDLDAGERQPGGLAQVEAPRESAIQANLDGVYENAEVDPNHDRRKRRKITPVPEQKQPLHSPREEVAEVKDAWLRQLEGAASEVTAEVETRVDEEVKTGSDELEQVKEPSVPEEIANLQHEAQQNPTTPPAESTVETTTNPETPPSQQTPSKMAKRSGGPLSATPKRAKKKDTPTKASPRKSARQSRNLTFKNGRLLSSLKLSFPYKSVSKEPVAFGDRIEAILNAPKSEPATTESGASFDQESKVVAPNTKELLPTTKAAKSAKSVHPFFLGKAASKPQPKPDESAKAQTPEPEQNNSAETKPVKSWSNLGFTTTKQSRTKDSDLISAPWPPRDLHHIGPDSATTTLSVSHDAEGLSKQKRELIRIAPNESVLDTFAATLSPSSAASKLRLPQQWRTEGSALLAEVQSKLPDIEPSPCVIDLQRRISSGQSPFDKGIPAGPLDWAHEYAPRKASDVLQPESIAFRDWLEKLKVHNVQSKLSAARRQKGRPIKKKRLKKRADDLDDFLVSDEEHEEQAPVKNAIIICGPSGCGKTASVYAAAQELDFEVFEIHPGMRRTAKDIFDKVGDMTHNHLVQPGNSAPLSRASSVVSELQDGTEEAKIAPDPKQKSLAAFVGKKAVTTTTAAQPKQIEERRETQKQSLILFEEVDVQFEEDKTFWSGVQSLIATSKRPIVLTCNSLEDIPMEEIEVAMVLHYERPATEPAVELLLHAAAAEGHLLEVEALRTLYLSRAQDLRAALNELNFWCQMTVGSTLGGLDWMYHESQHEDRVGELNPQRIVSKDTFYNYLHIVPQTQLDDQQLLAFGQDSLELSILDWEDNRAFDRIDSRACIEQLELAACVADTRSCMGTLDQSLAPSLSCAISRTYPLLNKPINRESIPAYLLREPIISTACIGEVANALEAITEDRRTFPLQTGRTAPSLDCERPTIATEVAPYVRHIVRLDQQIQRQRSEIDASSQGTGRQRTTRAARAALEGGSVAGTRVDPWFPKELDFDAVLATGGQWRSEESMESVYRTLSRQSTEATMSTQDTAFPEE